MTSVEVKSFGCSANIGDGEIMKGLLKESDFELKEEKPDVIIVNICTVKGDTHALREIRLAKDKNPGRKIIVAGCITRSLAVHIEKEFPEASLISTHNIQNIAHTVNKAISGEKIGLTNISNEIKAGLPKARKNPVIGIIQISNGCDSSCTFCSVKLVKGKLFSYPIESILNDIKKCIKEGCKEIWLTSQDNGCYGLDIGANLVELLKSAVEIEGDFTVRVGMANPKHVVKFYKELIEIYRHPKILKFLHIPVQNGSNEILSLMKREHTVEDYKSIVQRFREEIPEITISTDIICGFPGETKELFEDTLRLLKETKPDVCNISRFSPRYGTPASIMKNQVSSNEKKERSKLLTDVCREIALEQNKKWIGWRGIVLIDEAGKNNTWIGRNYSYKPIIVKGECKLGDYVHVRISDAAYYDLRAE